MISNADVVRIAAEEAGVPRADAGPCRCPLLVRDGGARVSEGAAAGTESGSRLESVRLMRAEAEVDCCKARRELGWQPRPVEESVREAARFWDEMRDGQAKSEIGGLIAELRCRGTCLSHDRMGFYSARH